MVLCKNERSTILMHHMKLHRYIRLSILFIQMALFANAAQAEATFCVEAQSMAPQCLYYDAKQCRLEAQKSSGLCIVNPQLRSFGHGNSVYCKTGADRVSQCIYEDFNACNAEAVKDGSVCVRNITKAKPPAEFQYQNGVYH
jgi:hypothetical protein